MTLRPHRAFAATIAAVFAAAVLVGTVHASTHAGDTSSECAICVVTHHAPATMSAGAPSPAPFWQLSAYGSDAPSLVLPARRPIAAVRGPPLAPSPIA